MENNTENKIENNNKNQSQIAAAILIVGVILAGVFLLKGSTPGTISKNNNTNGAIFEESDIFADIKIAPITAEDHILGNKDADFIVVEYSDTECPYCKVFHNTMHNIVEKSNNKVAWVYRHYPIPQLHKKAFKEAEATECAWEQGGNEMFWKYIDEVFTRTGSNDRLPVEELPKIAKDLGLNVSNFETCLSSGKFAQKIQNQMLDGEKAGIRGTPNSFILKNGEIVEIIEGAEPIESIMDKINNAI